jgi:hypothetical protein
MTNPFTHPSRRIFLLAGAGVAAFARLPAAGADFWNKKPPSDWTRDEIDRLIAKSPWAKEVNAQYAAGESNPGGGNGGGQGRPSVGIGGLSIPGLGGGRRRGNGAPQSGGASAYQGTVRWESAQPILDALKAPLPEAFDGHYVIGVIGIPMLGARPTSSADSDDADAARRNERDELDRMKDLSSLQLKGKPLVQAGVVARQVSTGHNYLLGFSKELLSIEMRDSEVAFATQMGRLVVKARFLLKEMLYHDGLAV